MSAILTPVGLLLIILAGYLFKRFGLFGQKDYRVLQTAEFNIRATRCHRILVRHQSA